MSSKNFMSYEDATTVLGAYAEAIKNTVKDVKVDGQSCLDSNRNAIVQITVPTEYEYTVSKVDNLNLKVTTKQNDVVTDETTYTLTGWSDPVDIDGHIELNYSDGLWVVKTLKASTSYPAEQTWSWLYMQTPNVPALTFEEAENHIGLSAAYADLKTNKQDTLTFDDVPTANSDNPVKSGGVKSAIDAAVSSAYHHAGTKTCAELIAGLLVAGNEGNVYNMTDSGTTTADFIEGAGQPIKAGDNVGIAKISNGVYKFDLLSGFVDTTNFVQKSETVGLLKNDGTVDTTIQGDVSTLKNGLTTLDNEVNGDATTYPYADVITIPDAIPANLADCSVKIEPVQDLHGYDKPWVGGAGKNKYNYVNGVMNVASYTEGVWTTSALNGYGVSVVEIDPLSCEATDYVISFEAKLESGTGSINLVLLQDDTGNTPESESRVNLLNPALTSTYQQYAVKLSFSSAETVARVVMQVTSVASSAVLNIKNVQIEKGATATTYEPYSNICPITGHTEASVQRDGVNLFDKDSADIQPWYIGGTDHKIGFNANTRSIIIQCKPSTTYTISKTAGTTLRAASIESASYAEFTQTEGYVANNTGSSLTITTTTNAQYLITTVRGSDDTVSVDDMINSVQIELGSSATDYEPFKGKTYTIALGDTIYGGTVDFDSGVMTVTHGIAEFNDTTGISLYHQYDGTTYNHAMFLIGLSYMRLSLSWDTDGLSSNIAEAKVIADADEYNNFTIRRRNNTRELFLFAPTYMGEVLLTDLANILNNTPMQICYDLETPFTVQLTPTQIQLLKGQNTITASTGQISVTVNGVSWAIGQVQEQVNDIAEDVAELQDDVSNITKNITNTVTLGTGVSKATVVKTGNIVSISCACTGIPNDVLLSGLPQSVAMSVAIDKRAYIYESGTSLICNASLNDDNVTIWYICV